MSHHHSCSLLAALLTWAVGEAVQLSPLASYMSVPVPAAVTALLDGRGITTATPIQHSALAPVADGESCLIHAETGSGKTLAMLLPALCRAHAQKDGAQLLVLSPTRELAIQLQDEAAALVRALTPPDGSEALAAGAVRVVAQGHSATPSDLIEACARPRLELSTARRVTTSHRPQLLRFSRVRPLARALARGPWAAVIVATPTELATLIGTATDGSTAAAGQLVESLGGSVCTLILDEVDALIPGRKLFRGKRHNKWMDAGMHPAEAVVKMLARRARRPDFQVLAASATLDQSTRRKVEKLLRNCAVLRREQSSAAVLRLVRPAGAPATPGGQEEGASAAETATGAAAADVEASVASSASSASSSAAAQAERVTMVPAEICHRTIEIAAAEMDGADGTAAAVRAAMAVYSRRKAHGTTLLFVSSRSTYLGGAHTIAREVRRQGGQCTPLSDAFWPTSTRSRKRRGPKKQAAAAPAAAATAASASSFGDAAERRAALNAATREGPGALLVADVAATRGLHLDGVSTVIVLGLPANADTYLHLAGRTARWPRPQAPGEAVAVTVLSSAELRTLRGWSNGLGGVRFAPFEAEAAEEAAPAAPAAVAEAA